MKNKQAIRTNLSLVALSTALTVLLANNFLRPAYAILQQGWWCPRNKQVADRCAGYLAGYSLVRISAGRPYSICNIAYKPLPAKPTPSDYGTYACCQYTASNNICVYGNGYTKVSGYTASLRSQYLILQCDNGMCHAPVKRSSVDDTGLRVSHANDTELNVSHVNDSSLTDSG